MSNDNINPYLENLESEEQEESRRKRLLVLFLLLLLLLCCAIGMFLRYLSNPAPLPEIIAPQVNINYPPHYLFSIYGVDQPVGVAVSSDGSRIYVSETGGERLIKIFDRDSNLLGSFAPPGTEIDDRSPVYIAVDASGRVFVADRIQNAIFIYDADGNFIDSILGPDMTLSKYLDQHLGGLLPEGTTYYYNTRKGMVNLTQPDETEEQALPAPNLTSWDPLGVRFDQDGNLLVTVVTDQSVRIFRANTLRPDMLVNFSGQVKTFGSYGQGTGQFQFPNAAVVDSQGRIHVSDGNNGRVSIWDAQGDYLLSYGRGTGDEALNLPRGTWLDNKDRLHVADAVGHTVRVYDVTGDEPTFLYNFGDLGNTDGLFYFPNDICMDNAGFLFIVDRENNRVQVWSY